MQKYQNKVKAKFIVFIVLFFTIFSLFNNITMSKESAVVEKAYFKPLERLVQTKFYFTFKNLSSKTSKLYAKMIEKKYPGLEKNWFFQFCYSDICYLDEGVSPKKFKPGQKETIDVSMTPFNETKTGDKTYINLEVYPVEDPTLKERIEFFGIVVDKTEIDLTVGKNTAKINDKSEKLDAAPFIDKQSGRTLVPLRFIGEKLTADIGWVAAESRVDYKLGDMTLSFWINKKEAQIKIGNNYNKTVALDIAPKIVNSRTFVPVRVVSELLGSKVEWDSKTQGIKIIFPLPVEE
jgi:hypothetical protein